MSEKSTTEDEERSGVVPDTEVSADRTLGTSRRDAPVITHTPGPWEAECEDKRCWSVKSEDYGRVALVHDPYADDFARQAQLGANARLIATAPDGLALAKRVAEHFAYTDAPLGAAARALIAKAEGSQP